MLHTFDIKNFQISAAGQPLSGFDDDEAFTIEWDEDWWTDSTGADGQVTRSHRNDRRAKVTIKLKQSSTSNGILNSLLLADELLVPASSATPPTFLLAIKSLVPGGSSYTANDCFIMKPPTITGGREASGREWVIRCPDLVPVILGKDL